MISSLRKFVPESLINVYHQSLSLLAAWWYGYPSEKMIIVGVTGTNGKTTTSYFISKALEAAGARTGCTTTALFKIGDREWLNDRKMTMLGRFQLQRMLAGMVEAGCAYAVIETSSQGILQSRHRNINYDVCVFTNLTPEHLEAHGGFDAYKQAKIELFHHLARSKRKTIKGKRIEKVAVLNRGSEFSKEFAVSGLDRVVWYGLGSGPGTRAEQLRDVPWGTAFQVQDVDFTIHLPGVVNVENALAAVTVAQCLDMDLPAISDKLSKIMGVPGRFERIDEGQPYTVIVDYAPEPAALSKIYEAISHVPHKRLIHVLGSCGGGRDVARRPILGKMAGETADVVVVTNEDPYDDNPRVIMDQVAEGARTVGKSDEALRVIEDRRQAIENAIGEARPGDLVLLTGKGCEQAIMGPRGSKIPWDEREEARKAIRHFLKD
jgi:UDP-N-acetylmuramoyl-L-alanyl-D-glutamate--2,6-diaminopimelate ligase